MNSLESDWPLAFIVPETLKVRARRAGFSLADISEAPIVSPTPGAILRALAGGATRVVCDLTEIPVERWHEFRAVASFAQTFSEILTTGETRDVRARGGLIASERFTRQRGAIVFATNPTENTLTGSVFPAIPEITLRPGETFPFVHDTPIGPANRYLDAYAGLVKSDAFVVDAHIRPDPFSGARVFVTGPVGETREVVVFGRARGESGLVSFSPFPQTFAIGESQVVALPESLAGKLWFGNDGRVAVGYDDISLWTGDTIVGQMPVGDAGGAIFFVEPDGAVTVGDTAALPHWASPVTLSAEISLAESFSGRFDPGDKALAFELLIDGLGVSPDDIALSAGAHVVELRLTELGPFGPAALLPDGACWLMGVETWRLSPGAGQSVAGRSGT